MITVFTQKKGLNSVNVSKAGILILFVVIILSTSFVTWTLLNYNSREHRDVFTQQGNAASDANLMLTIVKPNQTNMSK